MLKVGTKRRRTKAQIQAEKEEEIIKETAVQEKLARLDEQEALARNNAAAAEILTNMLKEGIAVRDENGNISVSSASKQRPQNNNGEPVDLDD